MKIACPCCRSKTLDERNSYEICPVCYWEDDGQDDSDADKVYGGPNSHLSLTQARKNYAEFGACEERFVACPCCNGPNCGLSARPPTSEEK